MLRGERHEIPDEFMVHPQAEQGFHVLLGDRQPPLCHPGGHALQQPVAETRQGVSLPERERLAEALGRFLEMVFRRRRPPGGHQPVELREVKLALLRPEEITGGFGDDRPADASLRQ